MSTVAIDLRELVVAPLACVLACAAGTQSNPSGSEVTRTEHPASFARVVMIGASVTAGFVEGRQILDSAIHAPHDEVESIATGFFGAAPKSILKNQIDEVRRHGATLVIAMDAPFWFLYQSSPIGMGCDHPRDSVRNEPAEIADARLKLLEHCLELLARIDVPLVIGEIPDMHEASLYIRPEQVPASDTLRRANERLHAWAQERRNVLVLPFASWTAQLRSGEMGLPPRLRTQGDERFPSEVVLRADRLHPSELGQVLLAAWLSNSIEDWLRPNECDFHLELEVIRNRLDRARL